MISIRKIEGDEIQEALRLAWEVFVDFNAPDYSEIGVGEFRGFVSEGWKQYEMTVWGAYDRGVLTGMIGVRPMRHISLFFVDRKYQGKGVGKSLFKAVRKEFRRKVITVNSSPYAVDIYRHLGFVPMSGEKLANGIRYVPMRFGICPCAKASSCPRSESCFECREHHSASGTGRPCDF